MPRGRKYSGPLLPGTKTVRGSTRKKHLNKTEKKEVTAIANRVVSKRAESKYFECNTLFNNTDDTMFASTPATNDQIYVKAYQLDFNGSIADSLQYGYNTAGTAMAIESLQMATCTQGTQTSQRVGDYASPSLCSTEFLFRRNHSEVTDTSRVWQPMVYHVRVIRVVPRTISGMNADDSIPNPKQDLFVNEKGDAIGIESGLNNFELSMYRVNRRKYKLILDKTLSINPPLTTALLASGTGGATGDVDAPMLAGKILPHMNFKHDLGNKLFYAQSGDTKPRAGMKNEYMLFHAFYPQQLANDSIKPDQLKLTCKSVSTFKDL